MRTNTPTLTTDRLILRKFHAADINDLISIFSDTIVNEFLPMYPLKNMDAAHKFFAENYIETYNKPFGYKYAICMKTDNIPIGYVNLSTNKSCDLGYGLRKEFWHKGIATEASKALLVQAKNDGFRYVTATHDINNPRSGSVMKALGMSYQYAYSELWQPKNIFVKFRMYQLNFDKNVPVYMEYWNKYEQHYIETNLCVE